MATIVNDRDVLLQAAGTRLLTVALPTNTTVDFANVNGTTKPSDNADVTVTAVNGGITVTGGGITLSAGGSIKGGQTAYATGTGFFLGYSSSLYRFSIGNSTDYMRWTGSALTIAGDISSTGVGSFEGSNSTADGAAALVANSSTGTAIGIRSYAPSNGVAVWGSSTGASGAGVNGASTTGAGVTGSASSSGGRGMYAQATNSGGIGIEAWNSAGGTALKVTGKMVMDNSTFTWNTRVISAPGGTVGKFLQDDGTWASLAKVIKYISSGATATTGSVTLGQAVGYLLVDTYDGSGQVKIPYYAV